jgi:hypothetical protein
MNDDIFIPAADSVMRYQAQLVELLDFNRSKTETIDMGRLPEIYTILGIADKQLKTNGKTILKALGLEGRNKHNVPMETVGDLLSLTYDPEAVFKSLSGSNNPGAYIAVLNAKTENQEQIIAVLSPSRDGRGFTFIPSVYEKHNFDRFLIRIYEEQKILYVKNKGSEIWGQLQSLPRHKSEPSIKNIPTKDDIVKQISNKEQIMTEADQKKLDRVNQLINEKAEVQKDGTLRISIEDWRGINRELNKANIEKNKLFEDAIRRIAIETEGDRTYAEKLEKQNKDEKVNPNFQFGHDGTSFPKSWSKEKIDEWYATNKSESPPLERRNINSKENFMSEQQNTEEQTFRPPVNAAEEVAKNEALINMKHQRKMVLEGLKNGTLSCLPGEDGFADTQPAVNLVNGTYYHGANLLDLKDHQKKNGFPTAEYVSEYQIENAKKDYPELSIKQGEKGLSIHWEKKNDQTGEWEKQSVFLFNVSQTTNPEAMKAYAEQKQQEERQSYIDYKRKSYPDWEPQEPKQKAPGPVIECSSTEPEKYLGQYLAAVSLGGKFKASKEQADEFSQKMENALNEKFKKLNAEGKYEEQDYPDVRNISKISNAANAYCRDVIQLSRQQENKEQYKQQQQQKQTQSPSFKR